MAVTDADNPLLGDTTYGSLLQQLQQIWDDVGESDEDRDKMLLEIDRECLDVYKRKVDQAVKSRAQLNQALADAENDLSCLLSALGEKTFVDIPNKTSGTIKEQLAAIAPVLEQLCKQKEERLREFSDVQSQIQKICGEITGKLNDQAPVVDESDLSLKKLEEYKAQLQELQKEKSDRLHKVLEFVSTVHDLCSVLSMDFLSTIMEVHPSLNDSSGVQSKSISNDTLSRLAKTVLALNEDKKQRLEKPEFGEDSSQQTGGARGSRSTGKRSRNAWCPEADLVLVGVWLNTSKDPITNTNQKAWLFWDRITKAWNQDKPAKQQERDEKSVKNRWATLSKNVMSFNRWYGIRSRKRASGESEADVLANARADFLEATGKEFSEEHIWRVLKDEPKWNQTFLNFLNKNHPSSGSAGSSKRSRSDVEGDTPTSAYSGHIIERPEGIKTAKRKAKKGKSSICVLQDERVHMIGIEKHEIVLKAHELAMAKETRRREKQAHDLELERKQQEFERKMQMLQWMSTQDNLGEDGEEVKKRLLKELADF